MRERTPSASVLSWYPERIPSEDIAFLLQREALERAGCESQTVAALLASDSFEWDFAAEEELVRQAAQLPIVRRGVRSELLDQLDREERRSMRRRRNMWSLLTSAALLMILVTWHEPRQASSNIAQQQQSELDQERHEKRNATFPIAAESLPPLSDKPTNALFAGNCEAWTLVEQFNEKRDRDRMTLSGCPAPAVRMQ